MVSRKEDLVFILPSAPVERENGVCRNTGVCGKNRVNI